MLEVVWASIQKNQPCQSNVCLEDQNADNPLQRARMSVDNYSCGMLAYTSGQKKRSRRNLVSFLRRYGVYAQCQIDSHIELLESFLEAHLRGQGIQYADSLLLQECTYGERVLCTSISPITWKQNLFLTHGDNWGVVRERGTKTAYTSVTLRLL